MGSSYRTATLNLQACRRSLLWMCPTIISAARWGWTTFCSACVLSLQWGVSHTACGFIFLWKVEGRMFQTLSFLKHIPCVFVCTHHYSFVKLCVWSYTPQLLFRRGGVFRPEVSVCPLQSVKKASVFLTPNFQQLWSCMPCAAFKQKL